MKNSMAKHPARILCGVLVFITAGCSTVKYADGKTSIMPVGWDYIDVQSPIDRASGDGKLSQVTDLHVLSFANEVKKFMDIRMNQKGVVRKASSSVQVMAAAVATALAAFKASVEVVAGFSGLSAIVPELQEIFQAKEGGEAFRQGSELIGDAITDYLSGRAGVVDPDHLTTEGVMLQRRVQASIVLVNKALLQLIPTKQEVDDAVEQTPSS